MLEKTNLARMLRGDLEAAGISWEDDADQTVDFHALRHTFISLMARAGVAPKVLMDLARHSDINLTMKHYSHTLVQDRAEALVALPDLLTETPQQQEAATGTYGELAGVPGQPLGDDKQSDKRKSELTQVGTPCRIRTCDQRIKNPLLKSYSL